MSDRPAVCTDAHLDYLDELRESGVVNMFGALPYLNKRFPSLGRQSGDVLAYWMQTFPRDKKDAGGTSK